MPNPPTAVAALGLLVAFAGCAVGHRAIEPLCPSPTERYGEIAPTWSPTGTELAFVSTVCGSRQLYIVRADGTGLRRLTQRDGGFDSEPSWSPDGRRIAFVSDRGDTLSLYAWRPDDGVVERLTDDGGNDVGQVAWSPDGTEFVFASDRAHDGRRAEQRPGGRYVLAAGSRDLYVGRIGETTLERITHNRVLDTVHAGGWSVDGALVFSSGRDGGKDVYARRASGDRIERLTTDGGSDYATVSADGRWLAYLSRPQNSEGTELFRMRLDGTERRRLTWCDGYDQDPAWSPDGRHIAFSSQRGGRTRLYVMAADGANVRRLTPELTPHGAAGSAECTVE